MPELVVNEYFTSIQGESHWAGYPCAFIRLAGCNLECSYCDTAYARDGASGRTWSLSEILDHVERAGITTAEVTGGEPLLQEATPALLAALAARGYRVLLETNGSLPLVGVPAGVIIIMDLKAPGSGMADANLWSNLDRLGPRDEVKVVCTDRSDYEWARTILRERDLLGRVRINLSPSSRELDPAVLAAWMLEDRLEVRLQVQLHRVLWPDIGRGV